MAYEHIRVKDLIENTNRVKDRIATDGFTSRPIDPNLTDISRIKFYDTIPVHNGLLEFMEQLHKEIPSIQFGVYRGTKGDEINISTDHNTRFNVRVACEMHAYLPDDMYSIGKIGFADYCTTKAKDGVMRTPSYMVSSSRVENTKYDSYREQFNMLMSKNLSTAVASAKKYLRQYSPQDIVRVVASKVSDSMSTVNYKKRRDSQDARSKLSDETTIKELKNLLTSGYTFLHAEVEQYIKDAVTKHDEYTQHKDKKVAGKFVTVSNQLGVQMFDVIPVTDVTYVDNIKTEINTNNGMRYRGDEMPEDLMGRVAVLSMAQSEDYIEGVGSRLGDTVFWVQDEA
jgi:hypothetical protein